MSELSLMEKNQYRQTSETADRTELCACKEFEPNRTSIFVEPEQNRTGTVTVLFLLCNIFLQCAGGARWETARRRVRQLRMARRPHSKCRGWAPRPRGRENLTPILVAMKST